MLIANEASNNDHGGTMKSYTSPKITDHGDVRAITAGKIGRIINDADKKTGDAALVNTTGVCVSGSPDFPCT